jgi:hypothetical protein
MPGSGSGSGTTVYWPELDELKQVLDVESSDWDGDLDDTRFTRLLSAAITCTKLDVGNWDDITDQPDANLAQAALRLAELIALKPENAAAASGDPTYRRLIYGHRRRFGIA